MERRFARKSDRRLDASEKAFRAAYLLTLRTTEEQGALPGHVDIRAVGEEEARSRLCQERWLTTRLQRLDA
jgi:acetylornithine deacetylase/succinyl-diaminopimelate desuccinylase-like protein